MNEDKYSEDGFDSEEHRRRRERRKKKKREKKLRRISMGRLAAAAFVLFFLVYISMLVYTSNFTMLETEQADYFEVTASVEAEATVLRSEQYITNSKKGIITYTLDEGEKVNSGGVVARLFASEAEVEQWQHRSDISSELELLKQMTGSSDSLFVDLDTVDLQIKNKLVQYKTEVSQNAFASSAQTKLDLLRLFNERSVVTGGSADFEARISELEGELAAIKVSEGIGVVKSKRSGFFSSKLDGYEYSLDYSRAAQLTADDVSTVIQKEPPSDAVGKVIDTINWYLLCPVTSEQSMTIASGSGVVDVSIPRVMSESIPATVVTVNQNSKTSSGLLVLKADYMDAKLANIRKETVAIRSKSYAGIRVARSAIHDDFITVQDYDEDGNKIGEPYQKKVQGVYVLYGKKLSFVQVHIIYSDNDFVLCSTDPEDKELLTGKTVALHDTVVVRGKELYDGKVVR